jgi:hypothetical protein
MSDLSGRPAAPLLVRQRGRYFDVLSGSKQEPRQCRSSWRIDPDYAVRPRPRPSAEPDVPRAGRTRPSTTRPSGSTAAGERASKDRPHRHLHAASFHRPTSMVAGGGHAGVKRSSLLSSHFRRPVPAEGRSGQRSAVSWPRLADSSHLRLSGNCLHAGNPPGISYACGFDAPQFPMLLVAPVVRDEWTTDAHRYPHPFRISVAEAKGNTLKWNHGPSYGSILHWGVGPCRGARAGDHHSRGGSAPRTSSPALCRRLPAPARRTGASWRWP